MPSLIEQLRDSLAVARPPLLAGDQDFGPFGTELHPAPVPAAVLVPLVRRPEPGLLLTTRTSHLRNHGGQVAFPGGRIDPGDDGPVAAALREAHEEIGLAPHAVEVLGLAERYHTGTGYAVQPVIGSIDPDLDFRPNADEVADLFEVPLAFALDPANHVIHEREWKGRLRRYYVIEWQGRMIWGATAGMLVNLSARLG
jgi:8-oxo-dGTP pyrophosphatase MutT (NUDIX family)